MNKLYDAYEAVGQKNYILAKNICSELTAGISDEKILTQVSKLVRYISRAENLDVYIKSLEGDKGSILNSDVYASVSELIFFNNVDFAEKFIESIVERGLVNRDEASIATVRKILHSAKNVIHKIDRNLVPGISEKIHLKERISSGPVGSIAEIGSKWGDFDCYENYSASKSINSFELDFMNETEERKHLLKRKGFSVNIPTDSLNKIFYGENVRVCTLEADMYAAFDGSHCYTRSASGRLAKIVPMNISEIPSRRLKKAIFLPVPHAIDNYYHVISEMIYPLRFASLVEKEIPIIYSKDWFKILPFFADRLNLDLNRFLSFDEVKDCSVDQALMIDKGSHFWGSDFYKFFNWSVNKGRASCKSGEVIYISRSKSPRGFPNEIELEIFLKNRGVKIIHSQDLTFSEQISVFEFASVVIAPHGAGITNILFSDPRTKLLEIFNNNYINPDFYLRTRQQGGKYACFILGDNGYISISEFSKVFDRLLAQ